MNMIDQERHSQALAAAAKGAAGHAHAPYSQFHVGAAVRAGSGAVYTGCNVENASLGLTQCAERTALTSAIADGAAPGSLNHLVIFTSGDRVHAPCGACRQVMVELMSPGSMVESHCSSGASKRWTLDELLPEPFTQESLLSSPGFERKN